MSTDTNTNAKAFGVKWADVDGDQDFDQSDLSMSALTGRPDKAGIKTVIEFYTNQEGQKVKVTRKLKLSTKSVRLNKRVVERRGWAKFGDCANAGPGPENNVTYTSPEVFQLDLRSKKKDSSDPNENSNKNDSNDSLDNPLQALQSGPGAMAKCRNCGEFGHFTLKCPHRQKLAPPSKTLKNDTPEESTGSSGKYIPLSRRGAAGSNSSGLSSIRDEATLRVTNLSEDVTEADLQELFRKFGHTTRIYLAKDRQTGRSRGFAFVNYQSRSEAQAAMDRLHGYGYDNLILHVEWSKPREKEEGAGPAGGKEKNEDDGDFRDKKPTGDVRRANLRY